MISWPLITKAGQEDICPPLSGLSRLDFSWKTVENWLQNHRDNIQALEFKSKKYIKSPTLSPVKEKNDHRLSRSKYARSHITNDQDFLIRHELDMVDKFVDVKPQKAYKKFRQIYEDTKSPRALYGMAMCLNNMAINDPNSSEAFKRQGKAASLFCKLMTMENVPLFLFMTSGRSCLQLRRHRNERSQLITALKLMKSRFPHAYEYASDLGFEYLKQRQWGQAIEQLKATVQRWPNKAGREKILWSLATQMAGENIPDPAVLTEPFPSHIKTKVATALKTLSDLYHELKLQKEAAVVDEFASIIGVFRSKYQRQIYDNNFFLPNLKAKPVWTLSELSPNISKSLQDLASHWQIIKNEGLAALFGSETNYQKEAENLKAEGRWQQLVLYEKGRLHEKGCQLAPKTCRLVQRLGLTRCKRGQVKFSVMHNGTHVKPHSGPTNTRLRAHLGLVIPAKGRVEMRVADQYLHWSEGKLFIIDDSFEHEVWHAGHGIRLVLLVDFWHPEVPAGLRSTLPPLPIEGSSNRTTIFHIEGIVSELKSLTYREPVGQPQVQVKDVMNGL